jgi:hypothetical protein
MYMTHAKPVLEELDEAECLRLIAAGGIGRIGFSGRYGPTVLPVNYQLYEGTMVFRTAQDSATDEDLRTGIADAEYKVAARQPHQLAAAIRWAAPARMILPSKAARSARLASPLRRPVFLARRLLTRTARRRHPRRQMSGTFGPGQSDMRLPFSDLPGHKGAGPGDKGENRCTTSCWWRLITHMSPSAC